MGKIVTVEYIDDLEGVPVDAQSVDTVDFSYRGQEYSLVLTAKNGAQFDKDIARYIRAAKQATSGDARAARKATQPAPRRSANAKPAPQRKRSTRSTAPAKPNAQQSRAIRDWAIANGHKVSQRGRIAAQVIEAYNAAQ